LTLENYDRWVSSLAWSPDGSRLLGGTRGSNGALCIWESRLEDALPMWRAEDSRRRVRPLVHSLFEEHSFLEPVLKALRDDHSLSEELGEVARRMARSLSAPEARSTDAPSEKTNTRDR
jgi:WD40 repeat protein